jgi:MFS superfamily sulfate permease-like transporter
MFDVNFYKSNLKFDLLSGFILFLIALPLSIGIALASGAPPTAGLLAAIVGGIFGSWLGGSQLTINGPAAGLIVVILGGIADITNAFPGSNAFQILLGSILLAGALQVVFGLLKLGRFALHFPEGVIQGMLTSIGVIIIIKQIPVALGVFPKEKDIAGLLFHIPEYLMSFNAEILMLTLIAFAFLIAVPRLAKIPSLSFFKFLPGPLLAIIAATIVGLAFDLQHEHAAHFMMWDLTVSPKYLLSVPDHFQDGLASPKFEFMMSPVVLKWALIIALIASIESVLSCFAVDRLDPLKRSSDLNRDLWSKGICNMILGFCGGLPIISEIVRSTANIEQNAKTRMSNFFHGVFILLFVLFFPQFLKMIPLGPLAAVLIMVGVRLAHPRNFLNAYKHGAIHFLSFMITLFLTVFVDLLVGIVGGGLFVLVAVFAKKMMGGSTPGKAQH